MKKNALILCFLCCCLVFSQKKGDILFVGFNTDGDKDFAVMTTVDLPENTIIYFTDDEPNVAGTGNVSNSEGVIKWETGTTIIPAGTVVTFTDVDNPTNANFGCSMGTLSDSVNDIGFNPTSSGDEIYATYGDPSYGVNSVTTWITGIQNNNDELNINFSATGLSITSNYIVIDDTASKDGGVYTGVKTGKTIAEYAQFITNEDYWTTSTSDGESFLPFDETAFVFSTLSSGKVEFNKPHVSVVDGVVVSSIGKILKVINVLGKEMSNQNLSRGIYIVLIEYNHNFETFKIVI